MGGNGPLIGRRSELDRLMAACRVDRSPGALVDGRSGVGKTRLVRETATAWSETGGSVSWVGATASSRRFSFGALVGLADDLDASDFGGSARQILDRLSKPDRGLLVVDDAHLLDDASATLVHRLALAPGPLALLVTVDGSQPSPDAVGALGKDGLLEVIELHPLRIEDVAAVLTSMLGGDVERTTSARLFELSEGSPFVLRELVDAATEAGTLARRRGVWCWRGRLPSSPRLDDLVTRRLERVDPEVRRVLEVLSLAEPLGLAELNAAVRPGAVADAEGAGLITVERRQRRVEVHFRQVLYAQLVRAELGQARTMEVLRTLDEVLQRFPAQLPADRLKRALIRLDVGEPRDSDAEAFTEASRLARPDHALAERFARAALEAGAGFTAIDYLLDALLWQGNIDEARQVAATVGDDLSPEEREYFQLRWSRMLWWMTGERPADPVAPRRVGDEQSPASVATTARQVGMAAAAGQGRKVLGTALALLDDPAADDEARCWAAGAAMIGLGGQGRVGEALAMTTDAYECARRLTDFNYRLLLSVVDIWLRRLSGDLRGARRAIDDLRQAQGAVSPVGPTPNAGLIALFEALLVLTSGRARDAVPHLRDAAAMLDDVDFAGLSASAHYWLAEAMVLTGDGPGAADQLALGAEAEEKTLDMFRPEQLLARAWACVGIGDRKLATLLLADAAHRASSQGEQLVEVRVHHAGLRLGDRGAGRRLTQLVQMVEGPFSASAGVHARAWLTGDPAELLRAAESFEEHGALVEAVDAVAHAARAARRSGDAARSRKLATRAAAMARGAGGIDTPALRAVALDIPLTRRQRDVARLAAGGLSSREIAERLGVGTRTVESHLEAAYRRAGVSSRAELAELFSAEDRA